MARHIPQEVLYHYTNANALLGIIRSRSIWASKIQYLNDAQEFDHAVGIAKNVILQKQQSSTNEREKETLALLGTLLEQVSKINIFVASFSEVRDSLSQWRGYCPTGAGYSIGFLANELVDQAATQGFFIRPCVYDYATQRQAIEPILNEAVASTLRRASTEPENSNPYPVEIGTFLQGFVQLAPTLKHMSFQEEREWRLISPPISFTDPRWSVSAGRSMLIPYIPVNLATNGADLPVREIVVGPTPHMALATEAVISLRFSECIPQLSVRDSRIPYRDW